MLIAVGNTTAKKRKHSERVADGEDVPYKKAKKEGKEKHKKHDRKGKRRDTEIDGEFITVSASVSLSIPPIFAKNYMVGALEMLDSLIMHYVPSLGGVMLAYTNAKPLSQTAMIKDECPFANCTVGFDATVWSPQIGMKLIGKINLCSPDHISLLVHRTFNVSIPRHHLPTESFEYVDGPAENDPELGVPTHDKDDPHYEEKMETDALPESLIDEDIFSTGGKWVHKIIEEQLGGSEGYLQFTVIGLTIANQMLSLVGSIQPDPFSERHVPQPAVASSSRRKEKDDEEVVDDELGDLLGANGVDSEDDDPFAALTRNAPEEGERVAVEGSAKPKDKKTKRKKGKGEDNNGADEAGEGADKLTKSKKRRKKSFADE